MRAGIKEKREVAKGTLLVVFDLLGREVDFKPGQYFWVTLVDPPYGAQVTFKACAGSPGWNAPTFAPWLEESIVAASRKVFGKDAVSVGSGNTSHTRSRSSADRFTRNRSRSAGFTPPPRSRN